MDGLKGEVKKSLNDVTPEQWDALRVKYAKAAEQEKMELENDEWAELSVHFEVAAQAQEKKIKEQLIALGWTPPAEVNPTPDEGLEYPSVDDPVESPVHYNTGSVECIEAIKASMSDTEFKGYLKGNAMKYLWRYDYKGKPVEDLKKAQWYLARLTEEVA